MSTWRATGPISWLDGGKNEGQNEPRSRGIFWDSWTIGEEEGLDSHALGHEGDGSRVSRQILGGLGGHYWVRRD